MSRRTLIFGLGSDFGDDRLGWHAVAQLNEQHPELAAIALRSPAELLDHLEDIDHLHLVDACQGAGPPGTIICRDWPAAEMSQLDFGGTHDLGLLAALEIAQRLSWLPARVTIWGVETPLNESGVSTESLCDAPLSPLVARAVATLLTQLIANVESTTRLAMEAHADHA
jgi:hydrogenase maturation protease